jgi:ribosomal protein L29
LREQVAKASIDSYTTDDRNFKKNRNLRKDLAKVLTILAETNEPVVEVEDKKAEDK